MFHNPYDYPSTPPPAGSGGSAAHQAGHYAENAPHAPAGHTAHPTGSSVPSAAPVPAGAAGTADRTETYTIAHDPSDPIFSTPQGFPTLQKNDGRIAWMMGLIGFGAMLIPFLPPLAMGIAMAEVGGRQKHKNPVAAKIGKNAARFGWVVIGLHGVTLLMVIILGAVFSTTGSSATGSSGTMTNLQVAVIILMIIPLILAQVVAPIVGGIMGIIGAAVPVSRAKAATILSRDPASGVQFSHDIPRG